MQPNFQLRSEAVAMRGALFTVVVTRLKNHNIISIYQVDKSVLIAYAS